jgi:hypothetical protein
MKMYRIYSPTCRKRDFRDRCVKRISKTDGLAETKVNGKL